MIGELIEVFKLIIEIYKGNVPLTQVYTVVAVVVGVAVVDIISEITKNRQSKNSIKIIIESVASSFIGFTLYLGIYMFILRIMGYFMKENMALSNRDIVWISIISYISFFVLFFLFFLYKKTLHTAIRGIIIGSHIILTALMVSVINRVWEPQVELPLFVLLFTMLFNTLVSIFFIVFGSAPDRKRKAAESHL
jgi:hypothetical protein